MNTKLQPTMDYHGGVLRLPPNRVWRTYPGGCQLDRIEGNKSPNDGSYPEDWIASTVRALNPNSTKADEGLARGIHAHGTDNIVQLIQRNPLYFLGGNHIARFGHNPMVLVKYLDSAVRLPFQVHPTVSFSQQHFNTNSGKTEAYYILGIRPGVTDPYIYVGFQRPPTREELKRMIVEQDIAAMEQCFDRIPVKPGDILMVPGGLPHAIGGGILMVEIMEPTDYVARVEFSVAGRIIPESARFMGRDVDFALDMFDYRPSSVATIEQQYRCVPRVLAEKDGFFREVLIDHVNTDKFRVLRTRITSECDWSPLGFTILLMVSGSCEVHCQGERIQLSTYDRILVPAGLKCMSIIPNKEAVFLECLPPI